MSAAVFDDLQARLRDEASLGGRVDLLLAGLAERMAATSNDQNVQKLARELRAASPLLGAALLEGVATEAVDA